MIVGQQKPLKEIWEMIREHKKVLVLGCNACVAVCHQGGTKQAEIITSLLRMQAIQAEVAWKLAVLNGSVSMNFSNLPWMQFPKRRLY
jgi:hypothetical protein